MKYVTLRNMERATKMIADKGYDWETANDIAIKCFEKAKENGMSVEWHISKITDKKVDN